ncbi:MAG: hypothetical protein LBS90_02475 [Oscillospiraceae bacterium]|jgi:Arc/MetJ-type ribon-helix-helix transcriptional regulator|nr:hypothetical protein [Oscillospiraceae bacterium]
MKSEKLTVNFTETEVAQIDYLTAGMGLYSGRSDFVRFAVQLELRRHESDFQQFLANGARGAEYRAATGSLTFSRGDLEEWRDAGQRAKIFVIGTLELRDDIDAKLAAQAIASVEVYGAFKARDEVKALFE